MKHSAPGFATVIMAAGKGTRMLNTEKAKVMFEVAGKPMVEHVVETALALGSSRIIAVVGYRKEAVVEHLRRVAPSVEIAVQEPQLGTGHAVMQAKQGLAGFVGDVLVLSGDAPLLKAQTVRQLAEHHRRQKAVGTILSAELADPTGYGRILRNDNRDVVGIVEEKDATPEQRKIREINSGIYLFDSVRLFEALAHINRDNVQKEYYLTDVFGYFWRSGLKVSAEMAADFDEVRGVNTVEQLAEAERLYRPRNGGNAKRV